MEETKITKHDLNKVFWRSHLIQSSWNYEGQMNVGYLYAMIPVLKKLYPDKEKLAKVMERQLALFNTTPQVATFIMGLNITMEQEAAKDEKFPVEAINAVKTSLMGPLAGVGDSFFWGTFKVIAAGVGIGFASQGSIIGPIISLILYNIPSLLTRYYGLKIGYKMGNSFLDRMSSGLMEKVTYMASIVGLMVVGCMVATLIDLNFALELSVQGQEPISLQNTLNTFLPKATPLLATGGLYMLVRKGISPTKILFGIIGIGIISAWLNIFVV